MGCGYPRVSFSGSRPGCLEPKHVGHRISPRRAVGEELGGQQGAPGVAVPAVPLVDQFQRLPEGTEDDRVLTDVVAGPDRMDPDLARGALPDQPFAPVD